MRTWGNPITGGFLLDEDQQKLYRETGILAVSDATGLSFGVINFWGSTEYVPTINSLVGNFNSLYLPESLNFIGDDAFSYNSHLSKVIFPNKTFTCGWAPFAKCPLLKDFYMQWNEEQLQDIRYLNNKEGVNGLNSLFYDYDEETEEGVNKKDVTIHLPSNASSSLIQLYKDTFKEYNEETEIGFGLDTKTLHWAYDADPIYIPQAKIDVLPIIAIVISSISLLGGSAMFGYWLKNRKN
ncbi:MAG: leucine-rich repeat domain-containing protein [Mycoplasma sp.]